MINLVPMTPQDFKKYATNNMYAEEISKAEGITVEEAMKAANDQLSQLLPKAEKTPNHYLFSVIEKDTKRIVGYFWFNYQDANAGAFAYDIYVDENTRRKGYAVQVMKQFEEKSKALGAKFTEVHVFHHNKKSAGLCEKLKYKATKVGKKSQMMRKELI